MRMEAREVEEDRAIAAVLSDMRRSGCDLRVPRNVDFYSYFKLEAPALQAGKALKDAGYPTTVYHDPERDEYLCKSHRKMTLTKKGLKPRHGRSRTSCKGTEESPTAGILTTSRSCGGVCRIAPYPPSSEVWWQGNEANASRAELPGR